MSGLSTVQRKPTYFKGLQGSLHQSKAGRDTTSKCCFPVCMSDVGTTSISKNTTFENRAHGPLLIKDGQFFSKCHFHLREKPNFYAYHTHYFWYIGGSLADFVFLKIALSELWHLKENQISNNNSAFALLFFFLITALPVVGM